MEACRFCAAPLQGSYYTVAGVARCCFKCAEEIPARQLAAQREALGRGIGFAAFAALVALMIHWSARELSQMGDWKTIAVWLRWGALALSSTLIAKAAMTGASGKGSRPLQWCVALFTYLAYALSGVPYFLEHSTAAQLNPVQIIVVLIVALFSPILAVFSTDGYPLGYVIITLVFLFSAIGMAWEKTGSRITLEGPFDVEKSPVEPLVDEKPAL